MGIVKFAVVACLIAGAVGLACGVFRLVEDDGAGGVRFDPRVSKPTLRWYVGKAEKALSDLDGRLKPAGEVAPRK